jgi:hypothetical protein
MARRLLITLGVVVALIVAAVIAGAVYTALKAPLSVSSQTPLTPENCAPGPCTDVQGYTMWVSNVHIDNDIVHMTVKFKNSSTSTHAAPEDLTLIDAERRQGQPIGDSPGCKVFARTNFNNGATFGPVDVCFRVVNTTPPWILHWSPDVGAFCCQKDLTIWPS